MNRIILTILLLLFSSVFMQSQQCRRYTNTFDVARSNNTVFTNMIILAPCPQTCEYQDIDSLDITNKGDWGLGKISENGNEFVGLYLDEQRLKTYSPDFSVGFSFVHSPKIIDVDFSEFRNPDGSWKDIPEYDKTAGDYVCNCKRSGNIIDPENPVVQQISDSLFGESNGSRLDYAERCYNYVATHYRYLNPNTGLHPLSDVLRSGGGDCGNLSSIYISLLRAKGIPARHVIAVGDNNNFHAWAEFYIQDFGWIPVDVTYKNADPQGNFFGRYDYDMVVVQKGVSMDYPLPLLGSHKVDLLQTFCYWYWYNTPADLSVKQKITSEEVVDERGKK